MNTFKRKKARTLSLLSTTALVSMLVVAIPTAAHAAAPACDKGLAINTCGGATSDGAPYVMKVPGNFNGTVVIFSHGYRPKSRFLLEFLFTVVTPLITRHNQGQLLEKTQQSFLTY